MAAASVILSGGAVLSAANWGSFWNDDGSQTISDSNVVAFMSFNSADGNNQGVSMVDSTKLTFAVAGTYSITFSIQWANTSATMYDSWIWLTKNGQTPEQNITDTASYFSVPGKHGTTNGHLIGTINFVLKMSAGDYLSFPWSAENSSVFMEKIPARGIPNTPVSPSVILTAIQV